MHLVGILLHILHVEMQTTNHTKRYEGKRKRESERKEEETKTFGHFGTIGSMASHKGQLMYCPGILQV